jgi:hypothetical protein
VNVRRIVSPELNVITHTNPSPLVPHPSEQPERWPDQRMRVFSDHRPKEL